jgi:hypothetical protein
MLVSLKKIIWWRLAQEGQILGNLICINKKNLMTDLIYFILTSLDMSIILI